MLGVLGFKKQASELTLPRYLKPALTGGMRGWRTPGPRVRGPLVSNRGCPLQSTEGPLERRYGSSPLIQYQRPPGARVKLKLGLGPTAPTSTYCGPPKLPIPLTIGLKPRVTIPTYGRPLQAQI